MKYSIFAILLFSVLAVSVFSIVATSRGPPEWLKEKARNVFEVDGVVYLDAKDDGYLEIGVVDEKVKNLVEEKLKSSGISLYKVKIVKAKPIIELATLRDEVRPIIGGLQISFAKKNSIYLCTLGFNAIIDGVEGFLTNSHCTAKEFNLDGTTHYQPIVGSGKEIGYEVLDPVAFKCNRLKCRWSDAAFSKKLDSVTNELGSIALVDNSLNILGKYKIIGKYFSNANLGTTLKKVGRSTGETEGVVTNTCVDVRPLGSNVVRLCQDIVSSNSQIVAAGDSGSPVFSVTDDLNTPEIEVTLYGILWGGSDDGTVFVYSPIANIEKDFGKTILVN